MSYRVLLWLFLGLVACGPSSANEDTSVEYVGSFSKLRLSQEHVYISEAWLWKVGENVMGLYLDRAGLQGSKLSVQLHKIRKGHLGRDGALSFETKWYHFQGNYLGGSIEGKLVQGSEVIWGGSEDNDQIELIRGSHMEDVQNPGHGITKLSDLNAWLDTLPGIQ